MGKDKEWVHEEKILGRKVIITAEFSSHRKKPRTSYSVGRDLKGTFIPEGYGGNIPATDPEELLVKLRTEIADMMTYPPKL